MTIDYDGTPIPPLEEPKKKNTTTIIIVVVAVIVLCCCCLIATVGLAWTFGDQIIKQLDTTGMLFYPLLV